MADSASTTLSNLAGAVRDPQFRKDVARGTMDAVNRGGIAGVLGGPVDLAAGAVNAGLMGGGYAAHRLGLLPTDKLPQPIQTPVGGSQWIGDRMEAAGMVSPQRNGAAEALATLATPAAGVRAARGIGALSELSPSLVPSSGGPRGMTSQLGAMSPEGRARLLADLQAGRSSGTYRLGDVTPGQAKALDRVGGLKASSNDVMMTDDTFRHLMQKRVNAEGYTPEEVTDFARRAMEKRAGADLDRSKSNQQPSLLNPGQFDPVTGRRYDARMPLASRGESFGARSVVPDGLPPRKK